MKQHLIRQMVFSRATFGPGPRTFGIIDHIKKELGEVSKCYDTEEKASVTITHVSEHVTETIVETFEFPIAGANKFRHEEAAKEWVDIVILGFDGLLRAISGANPEASLDKVATLAAAMLVEKQGKNELRTWPNWRDAPADKAIEHVRGKHD